MSNNKTLIIPILFLAFSFLTSCNKGEGLSSNNAFENCISFVDQGGIVEFTFLCFNEKDVLTWSFGGDTTRIETGSKVTHIFKRPGNNIVNLEVERELSTGSKVNLKGFLRLEIEEVCRKCECQFPFQDTFTLSFCGTRIQAIDFCNKDCRLNPYCRSCR